MIAAMRSMPDFKIVIWNHDLRDSKSGQMGESNVGTPGVVAVFACIAHIPGWLDRFNGALSRRFVTLISLFRPFFLGWRGRTWVAALFYCVLLEGNSPQPGFVMCAC